MGVVCASLLLERPLAPYYLTYITDPDTPFTAVVEMTQFVDPAEMGGKTLVYLPKYVSPEDPLLAAGERQRERLDDRRADGVLNLEHVVERDLSRV